MKINLIVPLLFCVLFSCKDEPKKEMPNVSFETVSADFMTWWIYHNEHIILSSEFLPIDENSNIIDKETFLTSLKTGNYIPLKMESLDESEPFKYKLFKIGEKADKSIRNTITNVSSTAFNQFKFEGTKFPDFDFVDLDGKPYNTANTKGKTLLLKCWFINCKPCVAEFPQLNAFVDDYKNRDDIVFVSLALDKEDDLMSFLETKPFNYATIPDQEEFIKDKLHVNIFPTHFLIDKDGVIKKVVTKFDELSMTLNGSGILDIENEAVTDVPPPPPSSMFLK